MVADLAPVAVALDYETPYRVFAATRKEAQQAAERLAARLDVKPFVSNTEPLGFGVETYSDHVVNDIWIRRSTDSITLIETVADTEAAFYCHWASTLGEPSLVVDLAQGSFTRRTADALRELVGCSVWEQLTGEECADDDE